MPRKKTVKKKPTKKKIVKKKTTKTTKKKKVVKTSVKDLKPEKEKVVTEEVTAVKQDI